MQAHTVESSREPDIGPYRVVSTIARGGMGVVYRAVHRETGVTVALKTVKAPDPSLVRGIRREIHALRRVRHPGVVRIVDEQVDTGAPWYAMELISGRTLRDHVASWWMGTRPAPTDPDDRVTVQEGGSGVRRASEPTLRGDPGLSPAKDTQRTMPPPGPSPTRPAGNGHLERGLTLVRGICASLAYLHGEGIVHRDLKPENVIVRDDGTPVIVDFGLVTAHGGAIGRESLDVAGALEGSFAYMAPEQVNGQLLDARADLYALGCILYEIVTGNVPFGGQAYALLRHHVFSPPTPPSERAADVPSELEFLILRLLAKKPADRLGFASDVSTILGQLGAGDPFAETSPPAKPYLYRPEFAGRADVLEKLQRDVAETIGGAGRLVMVGAESGAGKTRLAAEVATIANVRGMRVLTGECMPVERSGDGTHDSVHGVALHPFKSLLQAIADHCRAEGDAEADRILGENGAVFATYERAISDVPGVPPVDSLPTLSPEGARHRLFSAFTDALSQFSTVRPILLVLDDLQWADELSTSLLTAIARNLLPHVPAMVLATYREEETNVAIREMRGMAEDVRLDRLDASTVATMAEHMLALPSMPPHIAEFLAQRSSGNPFFVAEYLRAAVDSELLIRRGGSWVIANPSIESGFDERLPLPRSLRDIVRSRLSGLGASAKKLVQVASVLGREFSTELLLDASGVGDFEELEGSDELLQKRVLEIANGDQLRFAHDKLREIAYDGIDEPRRKAVHLAVAKALEVRRDKHGANERSVGELAHHFLEGGDRTKAITYFEIAGEQAHRMAAHADATTYLERALSLAHGEHAVSIERRARWERMITESRYAAGDHEECEVHAARTIELSGREIPKTDAQWALMLFREIAVQTAHRWLPHTTNAPPPTLDAARAAAQLAQCFYWKQRTVAMTACTTLSVNLGERAGATGNIRSEYAQLAYLIGLVKMHGVAEGYFVRAKKGAEGDPTAAAGLAFANFMEALYFVTFARWVEAEDSAQKALDLYQKLGDPQQIELAETMRVQPDFYSGRFEATLPRLDAVRRSARARGTTQHDGWGAYSSARSLIPLGRMHEAVMLLREAVKLLEGSGDRASEIICHGLLAVASWERGDARTALDEAEKVAELSKGVQPTVFSEGSGYDGASTVFLRVWEQKQKKRGPLAFLRKSKEELAARAAVAMSSKFAATFPWGKPAALRLEGTVAYLSGNQRAAIAKWRKSIALAVDVKMPFEEGLARLEMGRAAGVDRAQRREQLMLAKAVFSRLDCTLYAARCAEILDELG